MIELCRNVLDGCTWGSDRRQGYFYTFYVEARSNSTRRKMSDRYRLKFEIATCPSESDALRVGSRDGDTLQ